MVRPPQSWAEGRLLTPAAWQNHDPEWRFTLVTRAEPGQIGSPGQPGWSLRIRWAHTPDPASCDLTAHGFCIADESLGRTCGWVAAAGVLVLDVPRGVQVELESGQATVQHNGLYQELEVEDLSICLARKENLGPGQRYILAARTADHDLLRALVEARWSTDAETQWQASHQPLQAFWAAQSPVRPAANLALARAVDDLSGLLRIGTAALPFWWSAGHDENGAGQDTNDVYPLARAWSCLHPPAASDIVKTALSAQLEDGAIPRLVRPDGFHDTQWTPLPLLARSAWLAWQAQPDRDFHDYVMPRLHRYLWWTISYFDPEWRGLPVWRDAREAWTAETYNPLVATADLPAMLASELDAVRDLARAVPSGSPPQEDFLRYRASLGRTLAGFFWNQSASMFQDRFPAGDHVIRLTLSACLPLLDTTLARDTLQTVAERLDRGGSLRDPNGAREWSMWPDDPAPPPVNETHQLLVLDALEGAGETEVAAGLRQDLALRHAGEAPCHRPPAETALRVVTLGRPVQAAQPFAMISPLLTWMDQHRVAVLASVLTVVALLFGTIVATMLFKRTFTLQSAETSFGLARRLYQERRYDEALELIQEILDSGRSFPGIHFSLGNAYYQLGQWSAAEDAFRKELQRDPNAVMARLNLGLTLLRQQRKQEALNIYADITNRFAEADPGMAERAARAIRLVEEQPLAWPAETPASTGKKE